MLTMTPIKNVLRLIRCVAIISLAGTNSVRSQVSAADGLPEVGPRLVSNLVTTAEIQQPTFGFVDSEIRIPEGNDSHFLELTLALTSPLGETFSFSILPVDGWTETLRGEDFQFEEQRLSIPSGETEIRVVVEILGDTLVETDELFLIAVDSFSGGADQGNDIVYITLENDDFGEPMPFDLAITSALLSNEAAAPGFFTMYYVLGEVKGGDVFDNAIHHFSDCKLTAQLPADLEFLQGSVDIDTVAGRRTVPCQTEGDELSCDLGILNPTDTFDAGPLFTIAIDAQSPLNITFTLSGTPSPGVFDPEPANNSALTSTELTDWPIGEVEILGPAALNKQTGLLLQRIRFSNVSNATLPSVLLNIGNLPTDVTVFNASGTNESGPFIETFGALPPGGSVEFAVEFLRKSRATFENPSYTLGRLSEVPPATIQPQGRTMEIIRSIMDADDQFVIEFSSALGSTYYIQYKETVSEEEWKIAVPSINASANRTLWIDSGPPKTESRVPGNNQRLYRVIEARR